MREIPPDVSAESDRRRESSPHASSGAMALEQGLEHHRAGRLIEAERCYKRILESNPSDAEALHLLGVTAHQRGAHARAIELISAAIAAAPGNAVFFNNLGEAQRGAESLEAAAGSYRRALECDPAHAPAHNNLGLVHAARGELAAAEQCFRRAIELDDRDPGCHANLGNTLARQQRAGEAAEAFRQAIRLAPRVADLHVRLAHIELEQGLADRAVESLRRAADLDPRCTEAHASLAHVELHQRRYADAEAAARSAIELDAQHDAANASLGFALFNQGRLEEASDAFLAPVRRLRALGGASSDATFAKMSLTKLEHDIGQLEYLLQHGRIGADGAALLEDFRTFAREHAAGASRSMLMDVPPDHAIAPYYNRLLVDAPEPVIPGGTLNAALDLEAIEAAFHDSHPGFVQVDDLVNETALVALRRFCMEPTIWFEMRFHSEVGASLRNGFCCPLLLQIAADIQRAFPSIFAEHPFNTCWTYKYFQDDSDGHLHADEGAASVNFWVTPDDANLQPDSGGLLIWNKTIPGGYFRTSVEERVQTSLARIAEPDAERGYVPYRCNRAMIFRSNMLHKTERLKFKPGYVNRRVSITFLYGSPE